MTAENDHMRAAAEEKNALLLELQDVKNTERGEHNEFMSVIVEQQDRSNIVDPFLHQTVPLVSASA